MHKNSLINMKNFIDKYIDFSRKQKILDLGGQNINGSYKSLFPSEKTEYVCCDMVKNDGVDVVLKNPYNWGGLNSNSFDVVISGQTFEHVEYIWVTIMEIARVLKSGGLCCIIAPSSGYRHGYPLDCWRFYEDGMRALAQYAHLEVLEIYTQRDRLNYPDFDPVWQDSVLICKKELSGGIRKIKESIRLWMSRALVRNLPLPQSVEIKPVMQLFFNLNNTGYSEANSIKKDFENDKELQFDLLPFRKNLTGHLRFDPGQEPTFFTITEAFIVNEDTSEIELTILRTNGTHISENKFKFEHNDPSIWFDCSEISFASAEYMCVKGYFESLT